MGFLKQFAHIAVMLLFSAVLTANAHLSYAQAPIDQLLGVESAQENDATAQSDKSSDIDLSELPDSYFEEAEAYKIHCSSSQHLSTSYDCECLALALFNERVRRGPEASQDSILLSLNGSCKNAVNTAGRQYQNCIQSPSMVPDGKDREEFCSCFSNTFAKIYSESRASPSSRLHIAIHKRAAMGCKNPAIAKRLYPDVANMF